MANYLELRKRWALREEDRQLLGKIGSAVAERREGEGDHMSNSVVAKMSVSAINIYGSVGYPASSVAHFNAVYSPDPENPNHQWSKFTPSGTVKARRSGPTSPFDVGREYKVYLQPCEDSVEDAMFVSEFVHWDNRGSEPGITVKLKTRNNDYGKDWNEVDLSITNPACFDTFEMGKYFRLTTMPCEITEGP